MPPLPLRQESLPVPLPLPLCTSGHRCGLLHSPSACAGNIIVTTPQLVSFANALKTANLSSIPGTQITGRASGGQGRGEGRERWGCHSLRLPPGTHIPGRRWDGAYLCVWGGAGGSV